MLQHSEIPTSAPAPKRFWSDEEKRRLIELRQGHVSLLMIALDLGREYAAVRGMLTKLGVTGKVEQKRRGHEPWLSADLEHMHMMAQNMITTTGKYDLLALAEATGRGVDAIATQLGLLKKPTSELLELVLVDIQPTKSEKRYSDINGDIFTESEIIARSLDIDDMVPVDDDPEPILRNCMTCQKSFPSFDVFHRMCDPCKKQYSQSLI